MELTVVPIVKPDAANFIFGQSHFIKTVEDLHEALVGAVPGIRFGLAFCEASGKRLVRWSGNDEAAQAAPPAAEAATHRTRRSTRQDRGENLGGSSRPRCFVCSCPDA